jgi:hypothetical protein
MRTNDDEKKRDLWNAHTYTAMIARAESRTTTTIIITTTDADDDDDDDETAVVDTAR